MNKVIDVILCPLCRKLVKTSELANPDTPDGLCKACLMEIFDEVKHIYKPGMLQISPDPDIIEEVQKLKEEVSKLKQKRKEVAK